MKTDTRKVMRRKVKFMDLVATASSGWWSERDFEVLQWVLNSGTEFQSYTDGLHSIMFGYSANNHNGFVNLITPYQQIPRPAFRYLLLQAYTNLFVLPTSSESFLGQWREKEKVSLDGYRFLNFHDDRPEWRSDREEGRCDYFDFRHEIYLLGKLPGKPLKKEKCHPDYPNRINPYIKNVDFCLVGSRIKDTVFRWVIRLEFTFDMEGFERNGWTYDFVQQRNESPARFFWRVNKQIQDEWIDIEVIQNEK